MTKVDENTIRTCSCDSGSIVNGNCMNCYRGFGERRTEGNVEYNRNCMEIDGTECLLWSEWTL